MLLRWIIRGLVIELLLLCVGGWVFSYQTGTQVSSLYTFYRHNGSEIQAVIKDGQVHLIKTVGSYHVIMPKTWLGFGFRDSKFVSHTSESYWCWWGIIAFWFPTTLSVGLLWPIWRITRPTLIGRGFPVEIT